MKNQINNIFSAVLSPENTKLFKETNPYHAFMLSDEDFSKQRPHTTFGLIIEDFENGEYCFVNSLVQDNHTSNNHFRPNNAKPLKTIGDLNELWKSITGKDLTLI